MNTHDPHQPRDPKGQFGHKPQPEQVLGAGGVDLTGDPLSAGAPVDLPIGNPEGAARAAAILRHSFERGDFDYFEDEGNESNEALYRAMAAFERAADDEEVALDPEALSEALAVLSPDDRGGGPEYRKFVERAEASMRFAQLVTRDPQGRCWVQTEDDWSEAEKLRFKVTEPVDYWDLEPGDSIAVTEGERTIEYRLRQAAFKQTTRHGEQQQFVDVDNMSRGGSRLLDFNDGDVAAKMPPQIRVRQVTEVTEADLNRGWGL